MTEEAGVWRVAPFTTPSGIHVLRPIDAPLKQPDPGLSGHLQRQQSEPLLICLRALTKEQRELLGRGEIVDVTSASDTIGKLVRHRRLGTGSRWSLSEELVADSPLAATLQVLPTLFVCSTPVNPDAFFEIRLFHRWEASGLFLKHVQPRGDGATFWSPYTAPGAKREQVARKWRSEVRSLSGPGGDATLRLLPDLLSALDKPGASVPMADVNGTRLDRLFQDVTKLTGTELKVGPGWSAFTVYAEGGEVSIRAIVEAVFSAGRLGMIYLGEYGDDTLTVVYNPHRGTEASTELDREARQRPAPEVTDELRSLLPDALTRPSLAELPVPLSLFTDGYSGPLSGLTEREADWVAQTVSAWQRQIAAAGTPARAQGWLSGPEPITVRPVVVYELTVGACVPFRKVDPVKMDYVPADPPETYYTVLGASRDRPIYSTVNAVLKGY